MLFRSTTRTEPFSELADQPICAEVLIEKYAKDGEASVQEVRRRVARALAAVEPEEQRAHWERRFLEVQEQGFVPAGRINSAAGTDLAATLINCFVQPVGDSITDVVDGRPGIYTALAEAAVRVPCSSTKAITGHCLGASAALEAIVAIQAMREGCLPGSANCAQPDPQVRLNLLRTATAATVNSALSLSAGFWGNQAALAFQPA